MIFYRQLGIDVKIYAIKFKASKESEDLNCRAIYLIISILNITKYSYLPATTLN